MAESGVEILCVGTELLLGDILNSNARWIAEQLAGLGLRITGRPLSVTTRIAWFLPCAKRRSVAGFW